MRVHAIIVSALLAAAAAPWPADAQNRADDRGAGEGPAGPLLLRDRDGLQEQDRIYGYQVLTDEEIAEHRARLQAAQTEEERQRIRQEHRERVEARLGRLEGMIGDIRSSAGRRRSGRPRNGRRIRRRTGPAPRTLTPGRTPRTPVRSAQHCGPGRGFRAPLIRHA
jgi:hypothetical protein